MIGINLVVLCNVDLSQKWGDYTRVFSLMNSLAKRGHDISIFVIRPEKKHPRIVSTRENLLNVIEIHPRFTIFSGTKGVGKYINYLLCIPSILKEFATINKKDKINFVYSYMPGIGSSLPAMILKLRYGVKHVLDFADLHVFVRPKILVDRSFKDADIIIAITNYLQNDLVKRGIDVKKIHIIPNGVDIELFDPDKYDLSEIEKLRKSFDADKLVVFSGALQDLNLIINSAPRVIKNVPKTKFVILGDHRSPAKSKNAWEKIVHDKGLGRYFVFLGKKPREEVPKYLLCADVCVDSFPNEPYYAAAHPIKLLEYGSCGKPVVATKVEETEKIVKDKVHGFLSKPGDSSEFADHLITLLKSNDLCKKMGLEFSKYVRANFNWDKISLDLEKAMSN